MLSLHRVNLSPLRIAGTIFWTLNALLMGLLLFQQSGMDRITSMQSFRWYRHLGSINIYEMDGYLTAISAIGVLPCVVYWAYVQHQWIRRALCPNLSNELSITPQGSYIVQSAIRSLNTQFFIWIVLPLLITGQFVPMTWFLLAAWDGSHGFAPLFVDLIVILAPFLACCALVVDRVRTWILFLALLLFFGILGLLWLGEVGWQYRELNMIDFETRMFPHLCWPITIVAVSVRGLPVKLLQASAIYIAFTLLAFGTIFPVATFGTYFFIVGSAMIENTEGLLYVTSLVAAVFLYEGSITKVGRRKITLK